jgi:peroxiredoxin
MTKKKKKESWKERRRRIALKHQKAVEAERLRRERKPKRSKRWSRSRVLGIGSLFLIVLVIIVYAWQNTQPTSSVNGQPAPLFTFSDINGNTVSLKNLKGKVVVLDFFYIRCGWCDDQFLVLMNIHKSYGSSVVIISISIDPGYDTVDRLKEFKTGPNQYSSLDYEISWTITRDTSGVSAMYNINAAPTTVIVDKEGFISPHSPYIGLTSASEFSSEINMLLMTD